MMVEMEMLDVVHICVAMKPLDGTFASNALEYGVAGLNIDECRVGTNGEDLGDPDRFYGADNHTRGEWHRPHMTDEVMAAKHKLSFEKLQKLGRWPANVILGGSDEVKVLFPESRDGVAVGQNASAGRIYGGGKGLISQGKGVIKKGYGGEGSASRFFKECGIDKGECEDGEFVGQDQDGGGSI